MVTQFVCEESDTGAVKLAPYLVGWELVLRAIRHP